jgi:hypothetical protein
VFTRRRQTRKLIRVARMLRELDAASNRRAPRRKTALLRV